MRKREEEMLCNKAGIIVRCYTLILYSWLDEQIIIIIIIIILFCITELRIKMSFREVFVSCFIQEINGEII